MPDLQSRRQRGLTAARLRERVSELEAKLQRASESKGVGESKGQVEGLVSSSTQDSILAKYLNNASFK
ncbi:hypothetical protein ACLOJK_008484 [Asimina triloba]